ncbi:MAG: chromosome segregation protein ScpA [Bacillota bacterium]|nr:MAG: chromosome segregation protein ScpA [Bacillota bacterium]
MYQVRLAVFEGPLDLLLHLIEQQQVDIWQVSMAQVAEQYLEFLSQLPAVELEEAGEYLVMAALLVRIKARHLLPERKEQDEPEEDEAALEAALLARVAEYRRYKEAAARLEQLAAANARLFRRPPVLPAANPAPAGPPPGLTAETLARAFAAVLGRRPPEPPPPPPPRPVNLRAAIGRLLGALRRAGGRLGFWQLFRPRATRWDWIVNFLALLELVRQGRVRVRQPAPLAEFDVEMREDQETDGLGHAPAQPWLQGES